MDQEQRIAKLEAEVEALQATIQWLVQRTGSVQYGQGWPKKVQEQYNTAAARVTSNDPSQSTPMLRRLFQMDM